MDLDVVLLGVEWGPRALLRAQLIEEGFEVVATNAWSVVRQALLAGDVPPKLIIVDLQNLPRAAEVLRELGALIAPDRVLVLRASGVIAQEELEQRGFRVVNRPVRIKEVVAAVRSALMADVWLKCK